MLLLITLAPYTHMVNATATTGCERLGESQRLELSSNMQHTAMHIDNIDCSIDWDVINFSGQATTETALYAPFEHYLHALVPSRGVSHTLNIWFLWTELGLEFQSFKWTLLNRSLDYTYILHY